MVQDSQIIPFQGGLDLVTPAMMKAPGSVIASKNYEVKAEGYARCEGFEIFDGRPKPSEAEYWILFFDNGSAAISEDDTVTGATSGHTGIAVADAVVTAGTYGGGDAEGYLVLYNTTGVFQDNENLQVSAATKSTANGVATADSAADDTEHTTYIASVTAKRRAAISAPTGSGAIRGVATLLGDVYCWRDNAGATAGQMFKATASGWSLQSFGEYILFDAATAQFLEGETLTGGTSLATATIERVILRDGAWDGSGVGYLVLSGVAGGPFQNNEAITSASGAAVADGANVAITLAAGGRYRSIVENFYSQENTTRLYFVNGVGPAYEWDGSVLAPVFTGLTAALEKPKFIAAHRLHLFLGYDTGSIQHSATGTPLAFLATGGAAEFGFGQSVTGMKSHTRDSLVITGRNKVGYLVGSIPADFDLKSTSEDSGAIADTLEVVGNPIFLDDQGLRDMAASDSFGDWLIGTMTRKVEPLLRSLFRADVTVIGGLRVRAKDQYRLFYSDGYGLYVYFGRKDPEVMTFDLGVVPSCMTSGEDADGQEILFMGASDGKVYQLDAGTSFDGEAIEAFVRTPFLNMKQPNTEKRFHSARLEGKAADENSVISITADFSYGNADQPPSVGGEFTFYGRGGFWDEMLWNEFLWDSQLEGQALVPLDGIGENASIVIASSSATETPHTLSVLTVNFTRRRKLR